MARFARVVRFMRVASMIRSMVGREKQRYQVPRPIADSVGDSVVDIVADSEEDSVADWSTGVMIRSMVGRENRNR